jgi:hypothetical protein
MPNRKERRARRFHPPAIDRYKESTRQLIDWERKENVYTRVPLAPAMCCLNIGAVVKHRLKT